MHLLIYYVNKCSSTQLHILSISDLHVYLIATEKEEFGSLICVCKRNTGYWQSIRKLCSFISSAYIIYVNVNAVLHILSYLIYTYTSMFFSFLLQGDYGVSIKVLDEFMTELGCVEMKLSLKKRHKGWLFRIQSYSANEM